MKKVNLKILIPLIIGVVAIVGITVFLVSGKYGEDNTTSGNKILMDSTMDTELDKFESTEKNTTDNGVQDTTPEEETTSKEVVPTTKEPETTPKPTEPPTTEKYTEKPVETIPQPTKKAEVETTIPATTPYPTEAPTTKPVEAVTQPPTTEVPTTKEPETTPKPTEPPTTASKENVYVFNDDGTINFKESEINNYDEEFVNYVYQSNEVKNILGKKLYNSISYLELGKSSVTDIIVVETCINNEYWIIMHFDENWNIHKGSGGSIVSIYNPYDLPIKEDW